MLAWARGGREGPEVVVVVVVAKKGRLAHHCFGGRLAGRAWLVEVDSRVCGLGFVALEKHCVDAVSEVGLREND